ncbi:uncharacterized protein B0T23DRAFT_247719 [Neurospora hispaniola]|uniref:Uncharacterized protein n=1 Tax=Neurospora hispaniola TaxID=588809 RepID=A0AAJ0MMT8_9PEZI|nr:hypothetical protein B0T23DRAFT_247719 [Neurospora hispaniola]
MSYQRSTWQTLTLITDYLSEVSTMFLSVTRANSGLDITKILPTLHVLSDPTHLLYVNLLQRSKLWLISCTRCFCGVSLEPECPYTGDQTLDTKRLYSRRTMFCLLSEKEEGRRKKEEGRRKKEEGRRKKEEERRKKEEERRKRTITGKEQREKETRQ